MLSEWAVFRSNQRTSLHHKSSQRQNVNDYISDHVMYHNVVVNVCGRQGNKTNVIHT